MPFAQIAERAKDLPDLAEEDDAQFGHDLKIIDHAIKICEAYGDILSRAKTAFEADRERLVQIDEASSIAGGLAKSAIPEMYETRLTEMAVSIQFLNNQAGRFGQIGRTIGHTRNQLGRMATISTTVQTPALDAIQTFNLYQLRRLSAFGRSVNDNVLEQLRLNKQTLVEISAFAPDRTAEALEKAQGSLNQTFNALSSLFREDMKEQQDKAREISKATTDYLTDGGPRKETEQRALPDSFTRPFS